MKSTDTPSSIADKRSVAPDPNKKTFALSEHVIVEKAAYYNRLGIQIVADMYLPANIDRSRKYPAIIVGHPYGGVKEQSSGLYAQTLALRGFITIAMDLSYNGESGGQPRHIASPEGYVEDFMATVDYIGTRAFVDRQRIGVIGICGSGGFAVNATALDPRIRAVVTVSMYDMGRVNRQGLHDTMPEEQRRQILEEASEQRWAEFEGAPVKYNYGTPACIDENTDAVSREFYEYYRTPRGQVASSTTGMTVTSTPALMNFFPFNLIKTISPRHILFIAGENAHSRYFSEDAYKQASEPKELYIVPHAGHVDLYDKIALIPFDKIASFFKEVFN